MTTRKLKKLLRESFGKVPDVHYFQGDMEHIRAYFDFLREQEWEDFLVDDITWNDLDMDRIYRRLNPGLTTSGEQVLYYMLRSPSLDKESYEKREELISLMERAPELRLKLQLILARLGRTRRADLCRAFSPEDHSPWKLFVYLPLCLAVPLAALSILFWGQAGMMALVAVAALNALLHSFATRPIQKDMDTVNYAVSMVFAMKKMRRLKAPELEGPLEKAWESLTRLRSVVRTGGVSVGGDSSGMGEVITSVLLLDLIAYEFLKNKLGRCHGDVFTIHEHLGRLDAAIAVASYRASLGGKWCRPKIDFSAACPRFSAEAMRHPLLEHTVPNSLNTEQSVLVTGSNASGKSTFLKTAALCALMSQAVCTCPAESYRSSAFRILSSMALRDDLLAGESYYIVEIRSLKRILDSAGGLPPVLCVVDEVLRGTNTVERVAASSEVLRHLAESGALCLAATHDIELCALLKDRYALYHFEERVGDERMEFDYLLRPGRATSRNAIDLLRLMGFREEIISGAHERADRYLETGIWS